MQDRSYISFYDSIGEIPVVQDTSNNEVHFNRRRALYQDLGLPEAFLANAKILEFGPGSGDNASYLDSLNPPVLDLVDGAKPSIKALKLKKENGILKKSNIIYSPIEDYQSDQLYDIVICEGLIPGQKEPNLITSKAASHLKVGGVLVITTACHVSLFSEVLRRCLYPLIEKRATYLNQNTLDVCVDIFSKHLAHLKFSSRYPNDWVLDCIVQPWCDRYEYSVEDAIDCIAEGYEFYASSPRFNIDWRWYKEKVNNNNKCSDLAKVHFRKSRLQFIDCSSDFKTVTESEGVEVSKLCDEIYQVHNMLRGEDIDFGVLYAQLLHKVELLSKLNYISTFVKKALEDYITAVNQLLVVSSSDVDFGTFSGFWGRGQTYVSFVRKQ